MSGVVTAIGVAATVASTAYSISQSGAKASGASAENEVSSATSNASNARSQLLETAGGAAGSPLAPGQVSGSSSNTIFGN